MRFKINEIGDGGLALTVPVTSEWLATTCPDLGARLGDAGLVLRGRLSQTGDDYLLMGRLAGALETTCARCLEAARVSVDAQLAVTFVPTNLDQKDDEIDEADDVIAFGGNEIDLSDEIRDEILLALPLQSLCSEACRGLCSICGGNRNTAPCECEADQRQAASRFAALGKLKI
ncbi:MAG TPA: DUF177 domain-containing protein [Polyangia bacterium]|jgi:uncharacterized protein|nr:DUF177 domain-containing protein [Polyangia bacterium]